MDVYEIKNHNKYKYLVIGEEFKKTVNETYQFFTELDALIEDGMEQGIGDSNLSNLAAIKLTSMKESYIEALQLGDILSNSDFPGKVEVYFRLINIISSTSSTKKDDLLNEFRCLFRYGGDLNTITISADPHQSLSRQYGLVNHMHLSKVSSNQYLRCSLEGGRTLGTIPNFEHFLLLIKNDFTSVEQLADEIKYSIDREHDLSRVVTAHGLECVTNDFYRTFQDEEFNYNAVEWKKPLFDYNYMSVKFSKQPDIESKASTSSSVAIPRPPELEIIDFDGNGTTSSIHSNSLHTLNIFIVAVGKDTFKVTFEGSLRRFLSGIVDNSLGLMDDKIYINRDMITHVTLHSSKSVEEQSDEYQAYLSRRNQGEYLITKDINNNSDDDSDIY